MNTLLWKQVPFCSCLLLSNRFFSQQVSTSKVARSIAHTFSNSRMPITNRNNKHNKKKRQVNDKDEISIVGPDYFQLLQGKLFDKQVALILCGESHEDAVDVTRKGGIFDAKEGWIDLPRDDIMVDFVEEMKDILVQVLATTKKPQPLEKAKQWGKETVEGSDVYGKLVLLWVENPGEARVRKGKSFLLAFQSKDDEFDDDEEEEDCWISPYEMEGSGASSGRRILPLPVQEWVTGQNTTGITSVEWGDLDPQAFQLNRRRLTNEEIETKELDQIIQDRKERLRNKEQIWTWDDWFAHIQQNNNDEINVQLVLEASVPPWELTLHRPGVDDDIAIPPAADCIRRVDKDEEGEIEDDDDPASDGIGSYLDYIYRKFMEQQIQESPDQPKSSWLHCVDMRDLGCHAACRSESVQSIWKHLLTPEEENMLQAVAEKKEPFMELMPDSSGNKIKFVPEPIMNPERGFLETLRIEGKLAEVGNQDGSENEEKEQFTYPSFEGFFGQNSENLYYSKCVKLSYSPFLGKCVQSLAKWEQFFTNLFLGGTIADALSLLNLEDSKEYVYVRSPIQTIENQESLEYRLREDGEHYITFPFFPFLFHLVAKESSPPRTWSSNLFANLHRAGGDQKKLSDEARDWTLQTIQRNSIDPKGSDDLDCGGEWFEAYLHAVHRDIYDDIELHDTTALLKKNKMKSLTNSSYKHNIGKLTIPSCRDGFEEILQCFGESTTQITPQVEVMAKILIDIWMSRLVDFATVLKIAEIVSFSTASDKVIIVCYMGTAHTRAVTDFYVQRMGFQKKAFVGKVDWEERERRCLNVPKSLWNCANLFK